MLAFIVRSRFFVDGSGRLVDLREILNGSLKFCLLSVIGVVYVFFGQFF